MRLCTAPGCSEKHSAHGYCRIHRYRFENGRPLEKVNNKNREVDQKTLKELLTYDPLSGEFRWKVKIKGNVKPGDIAGCICSQGYRVIRIFNKNLKAHRLAWLYMHGEYPSVIDHIDRNRSNNSFNNLRIATRRENTVNRSSMSKNSSGYTGVHRHSKTGKWEALVIVKGKRIYLGIFEDPYEAAKVREAYCKENLGEFYKSDLVRRNP